MPFSHPAAFHQALLPQELLALAGDHERQQIAHYRRLAFRFLAFGQGVSRLMATLGIECERRLADIQQAGDALDEAPSTAEFTAAAGEPPRGLGHTAAGLITGRGAALVALKQAEATAAHAVRVAERLRQINATPSLETLLLGVVAQKQAERHILEELVATFEGEDATDTRLASRAWPRGWLAGARRLSGQP